MKELAKEELKILEAHHPTRFQFLKLELKEFIQFLDQQEDEQSYNRKQQNQNQKRFHLSILTEESSSRKREKKMKMKMKRKREEEQNEGYTRGRGRRTEGTNGAIQKAEACLRKIQTLKSLFCSSNH